MNNPHNIRSAASHQDSNTPETIASQTTIQQQPAGSSETKDFDTHPCITIKWSRDSASLRRIGLPPEAAVGAVAPVVAGVGGGSC